MKALLLTFSLGLIAALQTQAFPTSKEDQNVPETWYLKAIASDNDMIENNLEFVSMTPLTIKTLEGGSLQINFTSGIAGRCWPMRTILVKTDEPGKYMAYGSDFVVRIVESPVDGDYFLFHEWSTQLSRPRFQVQLVGRDPNITQKALKNLVNTAAARGLHTQNIIIPKQTDSCSPERN